MLILRPALMGIMMASEFTQRKRPQGLFDTDRFSWPTWYRWRSFDRRGIDPVCELEMVYVSYLLSRSSLTIPGFYINLPIGGASAILLFLVHIPDRLDKNRTEKATVLATLSKLDIG